jgi:prevent-host-death family protein
MFPEVGSFDAKARLSELLRAVEQGQRYTITLRGRPVADLVPSDRAAQQNAKAAVQAMLEMPRVRGIARETVADWIAEGRR